MVLLTRLIIKEILTGPHELRRTTNNIAFGIIKNKYMYIYIKETCGLEW